MPCDLQLSMPEDHIDTLSLLYMWRNKVPPPVSERDEYLNASQNQSDEDFMSVNVTVQRSESVSV